MIAESEKACSTCGEVKPLSQFHETTNGKGWSGRKASCKTCCCTRIAKRRAEANGRAYKPRPDDWGTRQSVCQCCGAMVDRATANCRRCRIKKNMDVVPHDEYEHWMANADRDWLRCMIRCRSKAKDKQRAHAAASDPWARKFSAICSGQRRRFVVMPIHREKATGKPCFSWRLCLVNAINQASARESTCRRKGGWWKKFDTMARNWRRKATEANSGEGNGGGADEIAEAAKVQMCFDWSRFDAK